MKNYKHEVQNHAWWRGFIDFLFPDIDCDMLGMS